MLITEARGAVKAAKGGLLDVQLISPGWGSSGYYSPEVLEAAGRTRVFGKGTKMFLDHPTPIENDERPNRSVKDLAAVLAEDAYWDGAALRAPVRTFGQWRELVAEMVDADADVIGVSIRADAQVSEGEAEGRTGYLIQEISNARSVDFVTEPGRGGRILQVLESARNDAAVAALTEEEPTVEPEIDPQPEPTPMPEPTPAEPAAPEVAPQDPAPENPPAADPSVGTAETTPTQEEKMPPEAYSGSGGTAPPRTTRQAYEERIAAKEREISEMRAREHARGIVAEDLELAVLPPLVRQRLSEELLTSMPMNAGGELDVIALRDRIAAKRDRAELEIGEALQLMGGHGQVRGLGGSMVAEDTGRVDEFQSQAARSLGIFGVSEEAARAAVKGAR